MSLRVMLKKFRDLVKSHPLVLATLAIWLISSPLLWFSGVWLGRGEVLLAVLAFGTYTVIGLVDVGVYWMLIFDSKE